MLMDISQGGKIFLPGLAPATWRSCRLLLDHEFHALAATGFTGRVLSTALNMSVGINTHSLYSLYFFQLHFDNDNEPDYAYPEKNERFVYNVLVVQG